MDPNARRKLMKGVGQVIDLAENVVDTSKPTVTKISGEGWQAYVYEPAGPASRTLHVEIKVGADTPVQEAA